ncbi:MAG TPA: alpha-amylase/4-alpha-glucanotransferase domain-containing protein [Planctomycetota bacterium]|nr:alpha-amylase/4-alpha-glucanotransferase domain-containing protein [Planctomycetota bacterium]
MTSELIIGLHCHQPVGNFPFVFREAFEKSYAPIVAALEAAPTVKVSLHYSGPLLEWLEKEEPRYLERVRTLAARGQVELWGSGFYEPILPAIPRADRIDQVKMMAERIHERFGVRPRGLWLTERVWEPTLASDLVAAGVEYIATDDHHFRLAGVDPERLGGYYLTEDEGKSLGVFPILKELRYRIPFADPEKVLEFCEERAAHGVAGPFTFYDDGEKLGVWPRTYKTAWEERWVARLFELLARGPVKTVLPGEVKDRDRPRGRIYLPTASYPEMMEWAFPADTGERFEDLLEKVEHGDDPERWREARPFLAGGFWRNFLVKYPEINFLQKRVVRASRLLRTQKSSAEPLRELFQSECNCAYWHGVFGGAYLPHLRRSLWHHLLVAERALAPSKIEIESADLEADGTPVLRIDAPRWTAHVKPGTGGVLLGLDLREPAYPLLDVIARRREAYHGKMVPASQVPAGAAAGGIHGRIKVLPEGVEVVSDWHRRATCVDHFYDHVPRAQELALARVRDQGDFAIEPFREEHQVSGGKASVTLSREGGIWQSGRRLPIRMTRTLHFSSEKQELSVSVYWKLDNLAGEPIDSVLATDWNLSLVPVLGHVYLVVKFPDGSELVHPDPESRETWGGPLPPQKPLTLDARPFQEFGFRDRTLGRRIRIVDASKQASVLAYPITTISQSEAGVDMVHQGTCFTTLRKLAIPAGTSATFAMEMVVEAL